MRTTRRIAGLASAALAVTVLSAPGTALATPAATATGRVASVAPGSGTTGTPLPLTSAEIAPPVRRLIVRMAGGGRVTTAVTSATAGLAKARTVKSLRRLGNGSTLVSLSSALSVTQAWRVARALTARGDVASAEPDLVLHRLGTPSPVTLNDPRALEQWDLWDSASGVPGGYGSRAPAAWSRTTGKASVVVAVIDTGITAHPDIPASSLVQGYDFISGDGTAGAAPYYIANDGDGRDADPSDPGDWITAAENAGTDPVSGTFFTTCGGENPDGSSDSSWHGTHVTGTIVAAQDNSLGISGIAPGVKVEPVRVLGKCGGSSSDIIDAIEWASGGTVPGAPVNANKASVISMSLGGLGSCDTETQKAISDARGRGTTVVVAAGNDGASVVPSKADPLNTGSNPADCAGVIDVVATDRSGHLASYSNYGAVSGSTAIAAPGGGAASVDDPNDILSTVNAGRTSPVTTPGGAYAHYAGTSMATPHVAAAVALMQSSVTTPLTPAEVTARLSATTTRLPSGSGCGSTRPCGTGILDVATALPTAPAAPTSLDGVASDAAVDLDWAAPASNGSPISGYRVEAEVVGSGTWDVIVANTHSTATTLHASAFADAAPLLNGTTYLVRIAAINGVGAGASATLGTELTPSTTVLPSPVTAPTVTGGVETLKVTWKPPADAGSDPSGITGYAVHVRPVGTTTWACLAGTAPLCSTGSTTTSATLHPWPTPLPAGAYEVQVAAIVAHGRGLFGPSGSAQVSALTQSMTLSGTTLRPFKDGFEDSITIKVSSNIRSGGTLRILTRTNVVVRTLTLTTAQSWAVPWNGRDSRGRTVANGIYHVQVLLRGRRTTAAALPERSIIVASSRASRPVIRVSSATVYPYRDGYLDSISISATATVPARWSWKLVGARGTVWTPTFSVRGTARATWTGRGDHNAALPAGAYTLSVTATGAEGPPVTSHRRLTISTKRLVGQRFSSVTNASDVLRALSGSVEPPFITNSSVALPEGSAVTFTWRLPTSAKPPTGVHLSVLSHAGSAGRLSARPRMAWFTGSDTRPVVGTSWALRSGTTVSPTSASAASEADRTLRWYSSNDDPSTATGASAWFLDTFVITGTRYVLG